MKKVQKKVKILIKKKVHIFERKIGRKIVTFWGQKVHQKKVSKNGQKRVENGQKSRF
jgi:hypothetical protein